MPLTPTFYGHIASTQDALLLFEACLSGQLNHVARRPHDRERSALIRSGNVFIYEEHSSGIKRWTDGVPWSPSRILGNFLVYRELERPFPPGEKKRAMKRAKRSPGLGNGELYTGANNGYNASPTFDQGTSNSPLSKETERSLIGSLIDSYGFKEAGLVKKTISVTVGGVSHHLVSYYTVADAMHGKFSTPSKDSRFQHITPRNDLITKQNFRTPIDEIDTLDRVDDRSVYSAYAGYNRSGYEMTNQSLSAHPRPLSLPTPAYPSGQPMFPNYSITSPGMYGEGGYATGPPSSGFGQFSPGTAVYPVKAENHDPYHHQRPYAPDGLPPPPPELQHRSSTGMTSFRRSSNFGVPSDSSVSGLSSASSDSKMSIDSGYMSQSGYYTHREEFRKMSLPTPTLQQPYDNRPVLQHYSSIDNPTRGSMWPLSGGGPSHHPQYMSPPPQNPQNANPQNSQNPQAPQNPQEPQNPQNSWTGSETTG